MHSLLVCVLILFVCLYVYIFGVAMPPNYFGGEIGAKPHEHNVYAHERLFCSCVYMTHDGVCSKLQRKDRRSIVL